MPAVVIVGAQWGDEAKGKIVDLLGADAELIVRFTGGNNAGHTVVSGGNTYKFHLLPSGLLHPNVRGAVTAGVVLCPKTLVKELSEFPGGVSPDRLIISPAAHIVLPYHPLLDGAEEELRGDRRIGTTRRGIGPTYMDKAARIGMRMAQFIDDGRRVPTMRLLIEEKNDALLRVGATALNAEQVIEEYSAYAGLLASYVGDAESLVAETVERRGNVLFEGAHGTLLDVDSGTYPYVTSTHTVAGGACLGTGIGPTAITHVLGIVKAYTSRVGEGPMPTELHGEQGECLRERGHEYGTTTGRPRRCGWLDLVALRYAAKVNGFTSVALTRLDVLSHYDQLSVCTAYTHRGETLRDYPVDTSVLAECQPIYEQVPGWEQEIGHCRSFGSLPVRAQAYVQMISDAIKTPVSVISVGADREATIRLPAVPIWS